MKKKKKKFNRYYAFVLCIVFVYTVIISRLFYLQGVKGEFYSDKANSKSHKMLLKIAPRGEIYDKNGEILATSRQSYMLIFTETDESKKSFYPTMTKVFSVLEENKSNIEDDFALKVDPFKFEFNLSSETSRKWSETRFKKDRGFHESILKNDFENKKEQDLSDKQKEELDNKLANISPEKVFETLICQESYKLYDLVKDDYIEGQWNALKDRNNIDKVKWTKEIEKKWKKTKDSEKISLLKNKYDNKTIRKYMVIKDKIKMQSFSGYKPVIIANDLSEELAYIFEQMQSDLPGISITKQPIREYPNGDLASSLLGYIRKINSEEQAKYEEKGYSASTDYIGAAGIEEKFEDILRGTKGQESIETNIFGRKVKTLGEQTPYPGNNIQLTIDKDLQKVAEKSLEDTLATLRKLRDRTPSGTKDDADKINATRGAAVVININTGAVLALASRPGYDPNLFTTPGRLSSEEYQKFFNPDLEKFGREYIQKSGLLNLSEFNGEKISSMSQKEKMEFLLEKLFPLDKNIKDNKTLREDRYDLYPKPFYNYATKSLIPPGSIFKPVTSIAGLEEGVITPETKIYDSGPYNKRYKEYRGASWMYNQYKGSHGSQNLYEALRDSNNYYMYEIADRLFEKGGIETKEGLNGIAKYAWQLGLGDNPDGNPLYSTGIEIDENFGQVYNYETGKKTLTVLYMQQLYEYLLNGNASIWGINYKSIDIIPRQNEDQKIYNLKKKLTDAIKKEMSLNGEALLNNSISTMIKELINMAPELKKKAYTDQDIKSMVEAIQASVNDARSEIKSGTNLYNASIGQGLNQFTPVQLANYVATLVNGGNRYKVHVVDKIIDPEGNVIKNYSEKPQVLSKTTINPANVESVKKGMKDVTSDGGTAARTFKDFPIQSGGKTGSATFSNLQHEIGRTAYGTFVGFAPYSKPEIAVAVVLFDGGHGSHASDVTKAIYEHYFRDEILKINPNYKFTYPEITLKDKDKNKEAVESKNVNNNKNENKDTINNEKDSKKNITTNKSTTNKNITNKSTTDKNMTNKNSTNNTSTKIKIEQNGNKITTDDKQTTTKKDKSNEDKADANIVNKKEENKKNEKVDSDKKEE